MYTNIVSYIGKEPEIMATIRVVDGKLQIEGGHIPASHAESLGLEYDHFKANHPDAPDKQFLDDQLGMMFAGSTYIKPKFFAEG